jgi:plastocyanin
VRRRLAAIPALAAVIVVAGGAAASTAEVTMPGRFYAPAHVDVLVGTTVTWKNVDQSTHTVTEDDDAFDSGHIRPGQSFAQPFDKPGTFEFHCTIHRFMRGSVNVFEVVLRGPAEPLPAGRRARLAGIAPADATSVVLEQLTPAPMRVVGQVRPGPDGAFAFVVRAPEPRRYRVRAGSAKSPIVKVHVEPRVAADSVAAGIAVHALPSRAGSRVVLQAYDRERFDWVTVARGRLDARSRATIPYRPSAREHVRAVVRGRGGWSDGASRPLVVGVG